MMSTNRATLNPLFKRAEATGHYPTSDRLAHQTATVKPTGAKEPPQVETLDQRLERVETEF